MSRCSSARLVDAQPSILSVDEIEICLITRRPYGRMVGT